MRNNTLEIRICVLFMFGVILILFHCCKKETEINLPVLTTIDVSEIKDSTAKSGGIITSGGEALIKARGVCWSTSQLPTLSNNKTSDSLVNGIFVSNISGLKANTLYYIRAYAVNKKGVGYGNQISFTTEKTVTVPILSTSFISKYTQTTGISGGSITSDGGATIIAVGVCWSQNQNPSLTDNNTVESEVKDTFVSSISNLQFNTTYYVRAYATNSKGTGYGDQVSFKTSIYTLDISFNSSSTYGMVTDIDDNTYKTIQIGTQVWMAENLRTTKFNDGTSIPLVTSNTAWGNLTTPGYCWYNNDSASYYSTYGALYNWYTVNTDKLCPIGWHVPSYTAEWTSFISYLDGENLAGGKIRETGITHWVTSNTVADNSSGFTALPSGFRSGSAGKFYGLGIGGYFWSTTKADTYNAYGPYLLYNNTDFYDHNGGALSNGLSVRCLKD
jgi:uncharacterized protein (TIGR02145 family)